MGLDAYDVTLDLIRQLRELERLIAKHDRDLADQLHRAASSVLLNLGEGECSLKGNKLKHYAIAHGSANEVRAALDLASAWGWVDAPPATRAILDRLLRMLWGLTH
jgi:four helix bundle protein